MSSSSSSSSSAAAVVMMSDVTHFCCSVSVASVITSSLTSSDCCWLALVVTRLQTKSPGGFHSTTCSDGFLLTHTTHTYGVTTVLLQRTRKHLPTASPQYYYSVLVNTYCTYGVTTVQRCVLVTHRFIRLCQAVVKWCSKCLESIGLEAKFWTVEANAVAAETEAWIP